MDGNSVKSLCIPFNLGTGETTCHLKEHENEDNKKSVQG